MNVLLPSLVLALTLAVASPAGSAESTPPSELHWYRGNTHTHTLNSDGDVAPDVAARWYREHRYQFVVITDHEYLTDVEPLNALIGAKDKFVVIRGEEVTQEIGSPTHMADMKIVHVNSINPVRVAHAAGEPYRGGIIRTAPAGMTVTQALLRNVHEVREAGGLAQVNHPNSLWSLGVDELLPLKGPFLFEIWNPNSNNLGGIDDMGHVALSTEALWDALLSAGKIVWAVGSDDAHDYHHFDDPESSTPGKAWVVVRAKELSAKAITQALSQGDFYASTGIVLSNYRADTREISIQISPSFSQISVPDTRYLTKFVGKNGRVLASVAGDSPTYSIHGDEGYVRALITDSDGRRGWTQPVFLDNRR